MIVFNIGVKMEALVSMRLVVTGECSNVDCIWVGYCKSCDIYCSLPSGMKELFLRPLYTVLRNSL